MFKHAIPQRNISDERNEQQENGRVSPVTGGDLAAAGVKPVASSEFIERVKRAIGEYARRDFTLTCGQLAARLSRDEIGNAHGGQWTTAMVKIFDEHYTKLNLRY